MGDDGVCAFSPSLRIETRRCAWGEGEQAEGADHDGGKPDGTIGHGQRVRWWGYWGSGTSRPYGAGHRTCFPREG